MNKFSKNSIVISKDAVRKKGGVVILDLKEYQRLCERIAPNYYLKGKTAGKLDRLVEKGLEEYKKGNCKGIKSLADLD
ncbi:MAG: hypothetical protein Athens101410_693 [Parcubacteria group bacterium Athens1014_10]|nr:MAG: hypothetical protein Athens101410_693 [Parcubacteria group bacterium Athens1014_10]TSD04606.1 MAG: hypothetical protein Athens071412_743 [Parcubacteria group bacterium Athens0714_12]